MGDRLRICLAREKPVGNDDEWWFRPRRCTVVVDNDSWILPFAHRLIADINSNGDAATFAADHASIEEGDVAFYLGCTKITPSAVLARHRRNLVVHESDLPKGRGFSPLTWQVLEGLSAIVVCLFEASDAVDSGQIIYRDTLRFAGDELIDEMRTQLGEITLTLCKRFLAERLPPPGEQQEGPPTFYRRRTPEDSRLDPHKSIAEQFDLLRVVDNRRYPAFFELRGKRFKVAIEKISQ